MAQLQGLATHHIRTVEIATGSARSLNDEVRCDAPKGVKTGSLLLSVRPSPDA